MPRLLAVSDAEVTAGVTAELDGVVLYNAPTLRRLYLQQGSEAGVFVETAVPLPEIRCADKVTVSGTVAREGALTFIASASVTRRGAGEVAASRPVSLPEVAAGREPFRWVETAGIVRSVSVDNNGMPSLLLVADGVPLVASFDRRYDAIDSYVDARVRMQGIPFPAIDARGQVTRTKLLVSYTALSILPERMPPASPFALPARTIESLRSLTSEEVSGHRLVVKGTVREVRPDRVLVLEDATGSLSVKTSQVPRVAAGDEIEVAGFPSLDEPHAVLEHALVRLADAAARAAAAPRDAPLRLIETAKGVQRLPPWEAARAYPVRIRGVLTYVYQAWNAGFIEDATGGVYINLPVDTAHLLEPGQLVEIEGPTGMGDFAPWLERSRFRILGRGAFPAPRRVSLDEIFSGRQDSNWVEMEGVVRAVSPAGTGQARLTIAAGQFRFEAFVVGYGDPLPMPLVDSKVRLRGVCGTSFNSKKQLVGIVLFVPRPDQVTVLDEARANPFDVPRRAIDSLTRFTGERQEHRVQVRGIVTFQRPGESLFVQDETGGVRVFTPDPIAVEPGDVVEVAGFEAPGDFTPILQDATFRRVGRAGPQAPVAVTADEVYTEAHDSQLIRIEAYLLDLTSHAGRDLLTVRAGRHTFSGIL